MSNSIGRFVWYELATTDTGVAKSFYASVLGWGAGEASTPGSVYSLFTSGNAPVAGLMRMPEGAIQSGAAPRWIGYIAVDDVDAITSRVRPLGGLVLVPPTDVPGVSRFSIIADPQDATLALIKGQGSGGEKPESDKPEKLGAPGRVGWYDLLATDLDKAFAFYHDLLGWQKTETDVSELGTYQQFSTGLAAAGGMFTRPDLTSSVWLFYFNVVDIEAAAKRVVAGGGQVHYGPVAVPGGARMAHCSDPQGALFALIDRRVRVAVGCYAPRETPI